MNESVNILRQFGFTINKEQESIYPFSPVYKIGDYIVKTTQFPIESAGNLVKYTTYLDEKGIPVVTPVKLNSSNPKQIDDDCFICYPFINGTDYQGTNDEIKQAGELLGRIHSFASKDNVFNLEKYDVFDFYYHEVDDHIKKIECFVNAYQVDMDTKGLKNLFYRAVENQEGLKNFRLMWIETPHDYKANNLKFNDKPTLVDPDNAAWIPRTFDLALSLLLFHNELSSAPDRVFTPTEWQLFLDGYLAHQTLTENEIKHWNKTVLHVFLDEVMWLLAEEAEDWNRKEQRDFFVSVTNVISNLEKYPIK